MEEIPWFHQSLSDCFWCWWLCKRHVHRGV